MTLSVTASLRVVAGKRAVLRQGMKKNPEMSKRKLSQVAVTLLRPGVNSFRQELGTRFLLMLADTAPAVSSHLKGALVHSIA